MTPKSPPCLSGKHTRIRTIEALAAVVPLRIQHTAEGYLERLGNTEGLSLSGCSRNIFLSKSIYFVISRISHLLAGLCLCPVTDPELPCRTALCPWPWTRSTMLLWKPFDWSRSSSSECCSKPLYSLGKSPKPVTFEWLECFARVLKWMCYFTLSMKLNWTNNTDMKLK